MASRAKSGRRRSSCMVCRHIRIWESAWRSYARLNREYDLIKRVCACVGGSYLYSHSAGHLTYRDNLWFGVFALRAMCVILQRQSQTIPYGRDQQGRMTLAAARLIWVAPLEFIGLPFPSSSPIRATRRSRLRSMCSARSSPRTTRRPSRATSWPWPRCSSSTSSPRSGSWAV